MGRFNITNSNITKSIDREMIVLGVNVEKKNQSRRKIVCIDIVSNNICFFGSYIESDASRSTSDC